MHQHNAVTVGQLYIFEIGFGMLAFLDALVRRPKSLGGARPKLIWMVVSLGMAFTAWITFLYVPVYFVVTYVMRQRRAGYRAGGFGGGGGPQPTTPYQGAGRFEGTTRQLCAACHGRGTENCYQCEGGMIRDGSGNLVRHNLCNMGTKQCSTCRGSGYA